MQVNKLTSTKTQLPYEWYHLPFCRPAEIVYKGENLGEVCTNNRWPRVLGTPSLSHDRACITNVGHEN